MRRTWRWFGPQDRVTVDDMLQAGVEGVVSALHHVPTGAVWSAGRNRAASGRDRAHEGRRAAFRAAWEVVESLPVSEDIKKQSGEWRAHLDAYKTSLENLAAAGIEVICYNFMPVLDWTRTDLAWRLPTGATCMRFDLRRFRRLRHAHPQARERARRISPTLLREEADERHAAMSEGAQEALAGNVVFGLPGAAEHMTLDMVRRHLAEYDRISPEAAARHLIDFLSEVVPRRKARPADVLPPDDPPFGLLGLPRVMSTEADYRTWRRGASPANGVTLVLGLARRAPDNDLPGMMERLGDRVHFLHLRNTSARRRRSAAPSTRPSIWAATPTWWRWSPRRWPRRRGAARRAGGLVDPVPARPRPGHHGRSRTARAAGLSGHRFAGSVSTSSR
jgi:mannonate dehydratase